MVINFHSVVDSLNRNQGAVMAVLTFVYVLATIVIVFFTRKSVTNAITLEKNRLRPYVIFNISSSTTSHMTFASVRNGGLTAAYNIKVTVHPELERIEGERSSLTENSILFLPPSEEVTDIIDFSPSFHQKYANPLFEGVVDYENYSGDKFREPFRIDLTFLKKRVFIRESVVDELRKVNETLTGIARQLERETFLRATEEKIPE
jgi:hypothetical protein